MASHAAGSPAPWAAHVAVAGLSRGDEDSPADGRWHERRARARRLKDAAFDEAWTPGACLLAGLALLLLVCLLVQAFGRPLEVVQGLWLLAVAGSAGSCVWMAARLRRRNRRSLGNPRATRRWLTALAVACLLLLSLYSWLASTPVPRPPWADALQIVLTMLLALALAPLRHVATMTALLPMSEGLAALAEAAAMGTSWQEAADPVPFGLAFGVVGLAWWGHRRWRRMREALMARDDQVEVLAGARDAALRADQEKSRFLAIASHDLRQPVHALGLFAATLEQRLQGSAEEPLVRNVMRSIEGLEQSFNAMLDISRLDAGTIEPNIQHFPLRDVFRRLHMHHAGQAEASGLGLRFSPGGKSVSSDPQLLERILGNLVQNALKYTRQGGVVVVARSTATHTNVEVWDTGPGMRAADLPRIFVEFLQLGDGQRSRTQGLGMGLAIVKRLAQLLGYRLVVASRPGRGTMFRLSIPLGGLPEIQDATAAADTVPMPVMEPRSVLVIDDEEPIREGLRILLEEWGYEATVAANAMEAEQSVQLRGLAPDLILSDLHLGAGRDGIAAIEAVRRLCGQEVPAILVTGDTTRDELRRATESGHTVLFKPLQPRRLFDAMRGMVP